MKPCTKCKIDKSETDYYPSELKKNYSKCKTCCIEYNKQWANKNPEKVIKSNKKWYQNNTNKAIASNKNWQKNNPVKVAAKSKRWRTKHPDQVREANKRWAKNNPLKIAAANKRWIKNNHKRQSMNQKRWREENPDKANKWRKENPIKAAASSRKSKAKRYKNDPAYRLHKLASKRVAAALVINNSAKNGESSKKYFPWTPEVYRTYIESLFEPWMNWSNQGIYNKRTWNDNESGTWTWQIDHIIPHSEFYYTSMDSPEFKDCWALSNLRPLSAKQNLMDGARRTRHFK